MKLAMDHGSGNTVLAVVKDGAVVLRENRCFSIRDNGLLIPWIRESLDRAGINSKAVTHWICGTGPGSFTGLRIAASSLMGFAAGAGVRAKVEGIPSALGVISQLNGATVGDTAAVLYDGRNRELLYYGVRFDDSGFWMPSGDNGVVSLNDVELLFNQFPRFVALTSLRAVFDDPRVTYVDAVDAVALIANPFRTACTELVYLRPAVFTSPKPIREV